MPTFRLEDEQGRWLTNMRSVATAWKPATESLADVTRSRWLRCGYDEEPVTLVVKGHGPEGD
jgi:hypothetical protein